MKVLAIDPGYGRCGMAVLEKVGGKETLLFSTCLETSPRLQFADRMKAVTEECVRIITEYSPDCVAMERLFFSGNQKTAMQVAEVRGALINTASMSNLKVSEYTPAQIKSAAGGWGGADKKQIIQMLHMLIKIEKKIKHDDEYDAIAVGITHLAIARTHTVPQ